MRSRGVEESGSRAEVGTRRESRNQGEARRHGEAAPTALSTTPRLHDSSTLRAGVDIGGTFTDLVVYDDATGAFVVGKTLTTPDDPSRAIETGLAETLAHRATRRWRLSAKSSTARPW